LRTTRRPAGPRVDAPDGPAAGADGLDLGDRLEDAEAVEDRLLGVLPEPLGDQADVEAGAAHVGREHLVVAEQAGHVGRGDHATRRAGLEVADGLARLAAGQAALALHHPAP